jgi:hypothetical protein
LFGGLLGEVVNEGVDQLVCEVIDDLLYLLLKTLDVYVGVVGVVDFAHPAGEVLWAVFGNVAKLC